MPMGLYMVINMIIVYVKLGHFSLRPSSQRMYSSSAIGDRLFGASSLTPMTGASLDVGRPATTGSSSSVTTRPLAVITLLRKTRLWGKSSRAVWT